MSTRLVWGNSNIPVVVLSRNGRHALIEFPINGDREMGTCTMSVREADLLEDNDT